MTDSNQASKELSYLEINGVRYAYLQSGEGPLILCLHGFPDTAHTWNDTTQRLSERGYRVVAPFMRGYAPTSLAPDGRYAMTHLAEDIVSMIESLGVEKAYLIGHDWGSAIAYTAAAMAPKKISAMACAAVPHPLALKLTPKQLFKSWYMIFFQFRGLSEQIVQRKHYAFIRFLWRKWSPNLSDSEAAPFIQFVRESLYDKVHITAVLRYYRESFSAENAKIAQSLFADPIGVPTIAIAGEVDGCIGNEQFLDMDEFFSSRYEHRELKGAGHFMHLEQPELFVEAICRFFTEEI